MTIVFQESRNSLYIPEIESLLDRVARLPEVESVTRSEKHPKFRPGYFTQYHLVGLKSGPGLPSKNDTIDRIEDLFKRDISPDLTVYVTGRAVVDRDAQRISKADLGRAELVALPLTLITLLFVFGSWVAAAIPIVMGLLSVSTTLGCLYWVAQQMEMSVLAINFASMLGLGLGIDYALLMVNRFRQERQVRSKSEAIARMVETAGEAVFVSGLTVCISLACLMMFPIALLRSISIAGSLVVMFSVTVALTVLPALLMLVGDRIRWSNDETTKPRGQFWRTIAQWVTRHSVLSLLGVLLVIIVLSAPFLQAELGLGDASVLPPDVPARQGVEVIQSAFGPGEPSPILLAVSTPNDQSKILSGEPIDRLYTLTQKFQGDPRVLRVKSLFNLPLPPVELPPEAPPETPIPTVLEQYKQLYTMVQPPPAIAEAVKVFSSETTTLIAITSKTDSHSPESHQLVKELRSMDFGPLQASVGGQTAMEIDTLAAVAQQFPRILGATMAITFVVLCILLSR
ncbi:MAG: MMPL family transporter [Alkalinema sp. RU_4_3]|nr:MMPL family transporter [Alkalinema sp. RU_4_3]